MYKMYLFLDSSSMGLYYFIFSFLGGILGFMFSFYMSLELSVPFILFSEDFYFMNVTSHGFIMLFFFITLFSSGFSSFLMPDLWAIKNMYLKEISVLSFYMILFSFVLLMGSLMFGEGVFAGWTLYTPLSLSEFSSSISLDLVIIWMHMFFLSSLFSSVNMILTVFVMFSFMESVFSNSSFIVSFILSSLLMILSSPSLMSVMVMLALDSSHCTYFFNYEYGGDPVLFQIMFWMFAHPEVYILVLPVFGVVTLVLEDLCWGGLFNSIGMSFSMFSLFILSFVVFGHHMVTVGYSLDFSGFFMTTTVIISMPTGVKVFSWLYNVFLMGVSFNLVLGFIEVFLFFFSFGGISGVFLSNVSLDMMFHDGYFVVGHFHVILGLASMFGFLSGVFYFFKSFLMWKNMIKMNMCFYVSLTFLLNVIFMPFHFLGFLGLPSSVSSYLFECFILVYMISLGTLGLYFLIWFFLIYFLFLLLNK